MDEISIEIYVLQREEGDFLTIYTRHMLSFE